MGHYALLSVSFLPVLEDRAVIFHIFFAFRCLCVIVIWLGSSDILQVDTGSYSIFSCVFIGTMLVLQVVGLGL